MVVCTGYKSSATQSFNCSYGSILAVTAAISSENPQGSLVVLDQSGSLLSTLATEVDGDGNPVGAIFPNVRSAPSVSQDGTIVFGTNGGKVIFQNAAGDVYEGSRAGDFGEIQSTPLSRLTGRPLS